MFVCAGDIESFSFATPIGVGLIDSAINLTRLALFDRPDSIVFIGSAGSYTRDYNIFDIVTSQNSSNIELSFLRDDSYSPIDNVIAQKESDIIVNSSNYITTNFELSQKLLKFNIKIENMEFFSVLKIAKEFEIPAIGIFVITNYCDKDAHTQFIKNHSKAKELLIKYINK